MATATARTESVIRKRDEPSSGRNVTPRVTTMTSISMNSEVIHGAPIRRGVVSWAVPCFKRTFEILVLMINQVTRLQDFKKNFGTLDPYIILWYYSFVFYYHLLRIKYEVGVATMQESVLINKLERSVPIANLSIAGPMIDAIRMLCISKTSDPGLGIVYPHLPELTYSAAQRYSLNSIYDLMLPNMLTFMNCSNGMIANATFNVNPRLDFTAVNPAAAAHAAARQNAESRLIPGTSIDPVLTHQMKQERNRTLNALKLPEPNDIVTILNGNDADLSDFMLMNGDFSQMGELISEITVFNNFFSEVTTLDKIALHDGAAFQIQTTYDRTFAAARPHSNAITNLNDIRLFSKEPNPLESDLKLASFFQLNMITPANFTPGGVAAQMGRVNTTVNGDFWAEPNRYASQTTDPNTSLAANISRTLKSFARTS